MTQWVHLWDSCPGKGVIYILSHDTSSYRNIFRVIRKDGECGESDSGDEKVTVSQGPEPGWWESCGGLGENRGSTARRGMRLEMPRDSRVLAHLATDHLSRGQTSEPWTSAWQRKRDTWQQKRVRDKWSYKDIKSSDHKTSHGASGKSS